MKIFSRIGLAMLLALGIWCVIPTSVSAMESGTITSVEDTEELENSLSKTLEWTRQIENATAFEGGTVLEVGESLKIGSDAEGDIYITCVSTNESLARSGFKTSYYRYYIYKNILGTNTIIVTVDLESQWYANGLDGYIQYLKGTYTTNHAAFNCAWSSTQYTTPYNHVIFLDVSSLIYEDCSILFGVTYSPYDESVSFGVG